MMKYPFVFLLLFGSLISIAQQKSGDSWAKVKSSGTGTLAVLYYEQPGLISKQANGQITGVCVDILKDFQKHIETKYGKKVNILYVGEETEFPGFLQPYKISTTYWA
jgi:hypothetical protein